MANTTRILSGRRVTFTDNPTKKVVKTVIRNGKKHKQIYWVSCGPTAKEQKKRQIESRRRYVNAKKKLAARRAKYAQSKRGK